MEYKSNRITLKEFIMLRPSQKGEFLSDQESFDYTSLHTNDTLSNAEEVWSLSSSPLKKSSKSKPFCNTDPNAVTLKDMVVKRQRNFIKEKTSKKKNNEKTQSKKIKKDYYDDKNVTSASFAKRQHTQKWNVEETKKFYKGLELFGTDFSMIAILFQSRNRLQIKNKFRKEEKASLKKIDDCLKNHENNKYSSLVGKIRKNSCSLDNLDKQMMEEIKQFSTNDNVVSV